MRSLAEYKQYLIAHNERRTDFIRAANSQRSWSTTRRNVLGGIAATIAAPLASKLVNAQPIIVAPRQRIGSQLELWVSQGGDDANTGFDAGHPLRTIQEAWRKVSFDYDLNGIGAYIRVLPGIYGNVFCAGQPVGHHVVDIHGFVAGDPTRVQVSSTSGVTAFNVEDLAWIVLSDMTFSCPGNAACLRSRQGSLVDYHNAAFTTNPNGYHIQCDGAWLNGTGQDVIFGGATSHWFVSSLGRLILGGGATVVSVTGSNYWAFLYVAGNGVFASDGWQSVGPGAGPGSSGIPYYVQLNGTVQLSGTTPPGNLQPVVAYGGQVI